MELVFEVMLELILEGCIEGSTNQKVPIIIRIILALFVIATFAFISLGLVFLGIMLIPKDFKVGLFIAAVGLLLAVASVFKITKLYLKKRR